MKRLLQRIEKYRNLASAALVLSLLTLAISSQAQQQQQQPAPTLGNETITQKVVRKAKELWNRYVVVPTQKPPAESQRNAARPTGNAPAPIVKVDGLPASSVGQPGDMQNPQNGATVGLKAGIASSAPAGPAQTNSAQSAASVNPPSAGGSVDLQTAPAKSAAAAGGKTPEISGTVTVLNLPRERSIHISEYMLDGNAKKLFENKVAAPIPTAPLMAAKEFAKIKGTKPAAITKVPLEKFPKLDMDLNPLKSKAMETVYSQKPYSELHLTAFKPLTPGEWKFLSALLIIQEDERCDIATPILHSLTKSSEWVAEANFHLAQCAARLKLNNEFFAAARKVIEARDKHYTPRIIEQLKVDAPPEYIDDLGSALERYVAAEKPKMKDSVVHTVAYLIAKNAAINEKYKSVLEWAPKVNADHGERYHESQFLLSLAQYHTNARAEAIKTLRTVLDKLQKSNSKGELQALVALDLGRMLFQDREFKEAQSKLITVTKDHPLWLQSLTEMGWSQLMAGDYEGAVGNMYSVHSPFFAPVYKPESFVIQTIGYLNLCQYGDAYKSLTKLENEYRNTIDKMEKFSTPGSDAEIYYDTVKKFFTIYHNKKEYPKASEQWRTDVNGLPMPVVREMARHRDFTNLQSALNRQIDEKPLYEKIPVAVQKELREMVTRTNSMKVKLDQGRRKLVLMTKRNDAQERAELESFVKHQQVRWEYEMFKQEIVKAAEVQLKGYQAAVIDVANKHRAALRKDIEKVLTRRLVRLKTELARMLDNNELLRYEVFAGSGENIRFQVAGGETAKRLPASAVPQSKALKWNFDGEYWEDEIGHYRSSIKSNCPDAKPSERAAN